MIYSAKYNYYKFPGGGIENGENPVDAMIRETREELGLVVLPDTVKEYGYVHRIQRSDRDETRRDCLNGKYEFVKGGFRLFAKSPLDKCFLERAAL
ncbi:MAG: NUDIX domain-containing protein [Lawsonibacter sp.]|nr:NUDIX domain-containing protein [Lawsonibacter sp.]